MFDLHVTTPPCDDGGFDETTTFELDPVTVRLECIKQAVFLCGGLASLGTVMRAAGAFADFALDDTRLEPEKTAEAAQVAAQAEGAARG